MTDFNAIGNIVRELFRDQIGELLLSSETCDGSCRVEFPLAIVLLSSVANEPLTVVSVSQNDSKESGIVDWKKLGMEGIPSVHAKLSNSTILSVKQILIDLLTKAGILRPQLPPEPQAAIEAEQGSNVPQISHSDPLRALQRQRRGRPDDMPDFDDEYDLRKSHGGGQGSPILAPIGDRDLGPTGANPQMRPFIDPLASGPDGGGMFPSPQHPLFRGKRQGDDDLPPGVPPGARFDDPFGGAGFKPPGGFPNGPGGSSNGPGGFF